MDTQSKIANARARYAINTRHGKHEEAAEARRDMTEGLFEKFLEDRYDDLKEVGADRLTEIINQNI